MEGMTGLDINISGSMPGRVPSGRGWFAELLDLLEVPEALHREDVMRVSPRAGLDRFRKPGHLLQVFPVLRVVGFEEVLKLPGRRVGGQLPCPARSMSRKTASERHNVREAPTEDLP